MNFVTKLVRYPIWFYKDGFQFWIRFFPRTITLIADMMGIKPIFKHFLSPFRKDTSPVGYGIGIFIRLVYGGAGIIAVVVAFFGLLGALLFYFSIPLFGFLLIISISDYTWPNILGVVILLAPLVFYIFFVALRNPRLTKDGYRVDWERDVMKRLELNPEGAIAAKDHGDFEQFLKERGLTLVDYEIVRQWVAHQRWLRESWKYWEDGHYKRFVGTNLGWVSGFMREAKYFTKNLTQDLPRRKVYEWQGLDQIIERILAVLVRDTHNNVLLVGDSGVGKTSVIYQIAKVMNERGGYQVIDLNIAGMLAGSGHEGEFERRFIKAMQEFRNAEIILVIEDIERLVSGGVAQYFYPVLDEADFPIIATTTPKSLRDVLDRETKFLNAFEKIPVEEPDIPDVLFILQEKVKEFERRYGVFITHQALKATVEIADRYIVDKAFPSKAIDLLDEACASVANGRFESDKQKTIQATHIEQMVSEMTGVSLGEVTENEQDKLLQLEQLLHGFIIGQDDAVQEIAAAMRRARSGLKSDERPIGSFLFVGPTGVGKTLTAKVFAQVYFGDREKMVRFDMSEYSEFGMTERFLDRISDQVRSTPFTVLLLDEFEKADQKIHNLFLQILEDGRATDTQGNVVDFKNTVIIATSNAQNVEQAFSPELRNRFDGIVTYKPLNPDQILEVVRLELGELGNKLYEKEISITFSPTLIQAIAQLGYDPKMGGRPIRRAIQDYIENPLADALIKEDIHAGDAIYLDWENDHLVIKNEVPVSPAPDQPAEGEVQV